MDIISHRQQMVSYPTLFHFIFPPLLVELFGARQFLPQKLSATYTIQGISGLTYLLRFIKFTTEYWQHVSRRFIAKTMIQNSFLKFVWRSS